MWDHLQKRNLGIEMRCRKAIKRIGPFIDGELGEQETPALREHLEACGECSQRYTTMRGLVRELSSLPAIVPIPEESYRLMNRLRREMAAPAAPRPVSHRGQVAAAALSALVLVTVAGVSLAVWNAGKPAPVAEETAGGEESETAAQKAGGQQETEGSAGETAGPGSTAAVLARPSLVTSGNDYTTSDLEGFRNDLGTRLDFYSTYWYANSGGVSQPDAVERLQASLTEDLAEQAAAEGHDPAELERAVTAVMEQMGDEPVLPCYAERARVEGKDAWLISVSGPEDYLLFPDPKQPPAMILASLGGIEGLKVSESLLREMAARLAPYSNGNAPLMPAGATKGKDGGSAVEEPPATETALDVTSREGDTAVVEEDFQSFLRRLAAQGTSLGLISALKGLNYEQVTMLLQGNWAALAADGVNLSDFLTPPQLLWAVDCASGEVLWAAE